MVPTYHLFWSAVWAGVAANAVERTRLYIARRRGRTAVSRRRRRRT
jgi:hypothetical protein